MDDLVLIQTFFPEIETEKTEKLIQFAALIKDWNERLNLVSRKEVDKIVPNHILPSLAIAKVCSFIDGSSVMDLGTGGGFPGIPLAICFPKTQFLLVDSIGKKIHAVQAMADELGLDNVKTLHGRGEAVKMKFDFVIGRAVTELPRFLEWIRSKIKPGKKSKLPNGVLYLKGGDLSEEIRKTGLKDVQIFNLEDFFNGEYCQTKCVVYISYDSLSH